MVTERLLPFSFGISSKRLGSCGPGGLGDTGGADCPCVPPNCSYLGDVGWAIVSTTSILDEARTRVTTIFTDSKEQSGLQVGAST